MSINGGSGTKGPGENNSLPGPVVHRYLKNFCMNSTFLQEERWQAYRKTGRIADEIIYENRCTEEFHKLKEILNA